jgi:hypothetical protein
MRLRGRGHTANYRSDARRSKSFGVPPGGAQCHKPAQSRP